MKQFLVYALIEPSGNPFYIGQTKQKPRKRKSQHIRNAKKHDNNLPINNKIRKLLREEIGIDIVVLESGVKENEIDDRERFWIKKYRRKYKIYNVSDGGRGGKGFTPEVIEKIRAAHLGSKRSQETRKKISEGKKGKPFSKEHKTNLSKARKKRVITEETRRKTSKTSTGKINIKQYKLIDPQGNVYFTKKGLSDFCREHDLTPSNICKVIRGERDNHKGWKAEKCQ